MPKLTLAELRKRVNPIDNKPDPNTPNRCNSADNPKTLSLDKIAKLLDLKWKYFNQDITAKMAGLRAPTLEYINKLLDMMEPNCACNAVEIDDNSYETIRNIGCIRVIEGCSWVKTGTKTVQTCACDTEKYESVCNRGQWWWDSVSKVFYTIYCGSNTTSTTHTFTRSRYEPTEVDIFEDLRKYVAHVCNKNYSTTAYKLDNDNICPDYYLRLPNYDNPAQTSINRGTTDNPIRVDVVTHYHREKCAEYSK